MANSLENYTYDGSDEPASSPWLTPGGVAVNPETGRPRVVIPTIEPTNVLERKANVPSQPAVDVAPRRTDLPSLLQYLSGMVDNLKARQFSTGTKIGNRLFGTGGEERYQTWPERMVRSGFSLPHDVMTGEQPMLRPGLRYEDFMDPTVTALPDTRNWLGKALNVDPVTLIHDPVIERAQDTAGLMGGSTLFSAPGAATLGSGAIRPDMRPPSLMPALKFEGKVYPAESRAKEFAPAHYEIFPDPVHQYMEKHGIEHMDEVPGLDYGFVDERGKFLTREEAGRYGTDMGLVHPDYRVIARRSGLNSEMLLSDTATPGAGLAALRNAPPFYSAVEHALEASNTKAASGAQWLGTLRNTKGVKPEEMEWLGLNDYLAQAQTEGRKVTKQEIQDYVQAHKLELRDVEKGSISRADAESLLGDYMHHAVDDFLHREGRDPTPDETAAIRNEIIEDIMQSPSDYGADVATKYESYVLPGGENYREHLITLPSTDVNARVFEYAKKNGINDIGEAYRRFREEGGPAVNENRDYHSSHWDEPNILAHVRTNDRMMEGGPSFKLRNKTSGNMTKAFDSEEAALAHRETLPEKLRPNLEVVPAGNKQVKSLHLEEVQSDWHQAGRDKGYKTGERPATKEEIKRGLARTNEQGEPVIGAHGVPDAPFKKSWPELAMKRMIRRAAEEGYDRVSWTPGDAQAARYDLSKSLNQVVAARKPDGTFIVKGLLPNGGTPHTFGEKIPVEKLPDYVGKELAAKIAKQEGTDSKIYEGVDLKVGGEGMREFYDKMLPKMVERIGKEHGIKVRKSEGRPDKFVVHKDDTIISPPEGFDTYNKARAWGEANVKGQGARVRQIEEAVPEVFYFDLPQSIRDAALGKGFPLYMSGLPFSFEPVDQSPWSKKP